MEDFVRIRKGEARKRYNAGETLLMLPCKVRTDNMYGLGYVFCKNDWGIDGMDFDKLVNTFEVYNCCSYLGQYAAYYIRTVQKGGNQ